MRPGGSSGLESESSPRRWLVDENVAPAVTVFLRTRGDDALDVKEQGWFGRPDSELFALAQQEHRIVLTYDAEFAALRRLQREHRGIVFIRLRELRPASVVTALARFLEKYGARDLTNTIATLSEARVRFRRAR